MDWPVYSLLGASGAVTAIIGSHPTMRCFEGTAPQDTPRPYVAWAAVAGAGPENYLGELPAMDQARVQVDCFAKDLPDTVALAKAVRNAIEPSAHMVSTPITLYEPETELYRVILEFDFFTAR